MVTETICTNSNKIFKGLCATCLDLVILKVCTKSNQDLAASLIDKITLHYKLCSQNFNSAL